MLFCFLYSVLLRKTGYIAIVQEIEGRQICLSFKFVGLVVQSVNYKVLKEVIVWEIL